MKEQRILPWFFFLFVCFASAVAGELWAKRSLRSPVDAVPRWVHASLSTSNRRKLSFSELLKGSITFSFQRSKSSKLTSDALCVLCIFHGRHGGHIWDI